MNENLRLIVKKDILLSFRSKSILGRFLLFQILGGLVSLAFCPQFGIGLIDGHGITHTLRLVGDWACAMFCGSLFLSSGLVVASLGMKGEELWWIWGRYKLGLVILPALMWGSLMLANISFRLPPETLSYSLLWIISAALTEALYLEFQRKKFLKACKIDTQQS